MTVFLILSGVAAFWLLSLLVHPFGRCWLCLGSRRRARKCRACQGYGRRQRTGSRTVHRIRRQVAAYWRGPRAGGGRL